METTTLIEQDVSCIAFDYLGRNLYIGSKTNHNIQLLAIGNTKNLTDTDSLQSMVVVAHSINEPSSTYRPVAIALNPASGYVKIVYKLTK